MTVSRHSSYYGSQTSTKRKTSLLRAKSLPLSLVDLTSGYLTKYAGLGQKSQRRYFTLGTHSLNYFEDSKMMNKIGSIPYRSFTDVIQRKTVPPMISTKTWSAKKTFILETTKKTYILMADSIEEANSWIRKLRSKTKHFQKFSVNEEVKIIAGPKDIIGRVGRIQLNENDDMKRLQDGKYAVIVVFDDKTVKEYWISPKDLRKKPKQHRIILEAGFIGFSIERNKIIEIVPNSQAYNAGIRVGWEIIEVNGQQQLADTITIVENIGKTNSTEKSTEILFSEGFVNEDEKNQLLQERSRNSFDFFLSMGISLYCRPSSQELWTLWKQFDKNHDRFMEVDDAKTFLKTVYEKFSIRGDEPNLTRLPEILDGKVLQWEQIHSFLWTNSVHNVKPITMERLRDAFRQIDLKNSGFVKHNDIYKKSEELLMIEGASKDTCSKILSTLNERKNGEEVSFLRWIHLFGPIYQTYLDSLKRNSIAHQDSQAGKLPVKIGTKIEGFAPLRYNSQVDFLINGHDVFNAMLEEIKKAKSEIFMAWWEFCYTLPVIRGLGIDDWKNPDGILSPILQKKAQDGVKIYILLWKASRALPTAELSDRATEALQALHSNIKVVSHPPYFPLSYSHHQKFIVVDREIAILGGMDWTIGRWDTTDHPLFDPEKKKYSGQDYYRNKFLSKSDVRNWWLKPTVDAPNLDRKEDPRWPWHDADVRVWGKAAADVSLNFIQRWNISCNDGSSLTAKKNFIKKLYKYGSPTSKMCTCQIVRSISQWSCGMSTEISYYHAYISAINSSRKYIYIGNQFFISKMGEPGAKNRLAEAILNRVKWAVENDVQFHVYIVTNHELVDHQMHRAIAYFMRQTLLQGKNCLMKRIERVLKGTSKKVNDVLSVCSLQKVEKNVSGKWKYMSIYCHSKILIVDDKVAVVGSANINDRSLVGDGDSEIGIIIWDDDNNNLIKDFRIKLWLPFLGLDDSKKNRQLIDEPSSQKTFSLWYQTARTNRILLTIVFPSSPQDSILSHSEWNLLKNENKLRNPDRLVSFKGYLTEFPRHFLSDNNKRGYREWLCAEMPFIKRNLI